MDMVRGGELAIVRRDCYTWTVSKRVIGRSESKQVWRNGELS
jgi:hypothetical protein